MADLSFLPPIAGDAIEVDPLDLDNHQPPPPTPFRDAAAAAGGQLPSAADRRPG